MLVSLEQQELAKRIVNSCNYSFLNIEDISRNFKDLGFLVNKNKMIGYTSYMEYDEEKMHGVISYSIEESLKKQKEILLLNFSYFITSNDKNIKIYYKDIPTKNSLKRFSRLLTDASVDKEFCVYDESMKQGGIKK